MVPIQNIAEEPYLEGTFTLHGNNNVDATIKVKHSESGPDGVQNFEISFVNLYSDEFYGRLYLPDTQIRGTKLCCFCYKSANVKVYR